MAGRIFGINHTAPQGGRKEKMGLPDRQANFLGLFYRFGIDRLDFGIRRQDGTFIQRDLQSLDPEDINKTLPFLRAENARGSDVYFRPAQEGSWPVIFLDDLTNQETRGIARKYQSWIIETSPGLHHAWIRTDRPLSREERYLEQSRVVSLGIGDPGSVSGEHFGRFPGFRNWKRQGTWVNLISFPDAKRSRLPTSASSPPRGGRRGSSKRPFTGAGGNDASDSGREWGWVCGSVEHGRDPDEIRRKLEIRARDRGKNDPEGYARRTVAKALSFKDKA